LRSVIEHGVMSGTRVALVFTAVVLGVGTVVSFLIPNTARPEPKGGVEVPDAPRSNGLPARTTD
jgi:hypothetical protein